MHTCKVCEHPDHTAIEAALTARVPLRAIAQRFGVARATLGRHTDHLTLQRGAVPARDTPPRAPDPPVPQLPTVAQCAAHLEQLTTRLAACQVELETAAQALPQTHQAVRAARWKEDPVRLYQAEETLTRVLEQVEDLTAGVTVLEEARRQAAWELAQAQDRRTQQETQHWLTVVLPQLDDEFERYCCRLLAHRSGLPPTTTPAAELRHLGPKGAGELRKQVCKNLRERYPVVEDTVYA